MVQSFVRDDRGDEELTGNQLAAAGIDYPDWVDRYLAIRPGSTGELVSQTARQITAGCPKTSAIHTTWLSRSRTSSGRQAASST